MAQSVLSREQIEELDSMWRAPGFTPTMIAVFAAFGAWSLLLPVVPLAALDAGHGALIAGATTGVFMAATVATQVLTPALLRAFGYRPVMAVSAFMLGVPALGHLLGAEAWHLLLFSALRGVGFGSLTVAESALMAELVPARFLGKATGMLGVFVGVAQMVFLPLGLALVGRVGDGPIYVLAAFVALVAAAMCLRIPGIRAQAETVDPTEGQDPPQAAMWKLVLVPALTMTTLAMSFGAVSSFLPAAVRELDPVSGAVIGGAVLSITGGATMALRFASGVVADRRGHPGGAMIPGQLLALTGVGLMAVTVLNDWSVWWLVAAGVLFGGGFGMVQNDALLSMFFRLPRSKVSEASAVWNIAFDAGTGLGSIVLGAVAAQIAYSGAFGTGAAIIAFGLLATVADRVVGHVRGRA